MTISTWSFYDIATGIFSGAGFSGDSDDLDAQLAHKGAGVGAFEGEADHLCERVDAATGRLVPYRPPAPPDSDLQTWAWVDATKRWAPVKTLAAIRADKWTAIKVSRDAAINSPLVTPHGIFDSDPLSRANIAGAVALAQTLAAATPPFSITYTLADNTSVVLDGPGMVSVGLLLGAKVQAAFATARALRVRIDAAMTADAVAAITWPAE